jgi:di/tricarboxylate transporter
MGIVFLVLGILYMLFIGRFLLPKRNPKNKFEDSIDLGNYLSEIIITDKFEQQDVPISKQKIFNLLQIKALQIVRSDQRKVRVYPNTAIQVGDIIRISSDKESLEKIKSYQGIILKVDLVWKEELVTDSEDRLYEAVITPNSFLVNQSIKSLNFKELFNQVLVIGIRLRAGMMSNKLTKTDLRAGDILLLRATEERISSIQNSDGLVLISQTSSKVLDKSRIILAVLVLVAVIGLSVFNILPIVVSALAGALSMILLKVLKAEQAYKSIDWKVILMLAGILSMGTALEKTGGSELLGRLIVEGVGDYGPRVVLSALFAITFIMTNVMSNNATAALLAPIAISIASALDVDSRPLLMAVTFAASLSFMTPMGYQTNTMVYSPGNYKFKDYLIVGTPLNLIFWIIATLLIPILFPF